MNEIYATCDKDGYRKVAKYLGVPLMTEWGSWVENHVRTVAFHGELEDLPDFPAPGEFKKVTRLSILPLEIEYEAPPFVGKVWACCDKSGLREVREDREDSEVCLFLGSWVHGSTTFFGKCLNTIPNWPAPGQRRELRCVPTLNIEWADEPKQETPRFDPEVVERVVKYLGQQFDSFFRGAFAHGPKWDQLARDLCTLRDQMNGK